LSDGGEVTQQFIELSGNCFKPSKQSTL